MLDGIGKPQSRGAGACRCCSAEQLKGLSAIIDLLLHDAERPAAVDGVAKGKDQAVWSEFNGMRFET